MLHRKCAVPASIIYQTRMERGITRAQLMTETGRPIVATATLLLGLSLAAADVAVEHTGRIQRGRLLAESGVWTFRTELGKPLALDQLSHVRFDATPVPLPKAPLRWALRLPNQQRVSGSLIRADEKSVVFVTSWGQKATLGRELLQGIEQATDALPIVHDDFETLSKSWRIKGKATLNQERPFFGKSSLRFDQFGQSAALDWPALPSGTIRLFFDAPAIPANARWTVGVMLESNGEAGPALLIDQAGYSGASVKQTFGVVQATPGWHLLCIEIESERVRLFVDDHCLGQTTVPANEAIKGIRIVADGKENAKVWIDELFVTRRLPLLPTPQAIKDHDMVWLEHGEQLFGRIVAADAESVSLDAKFGKRTMAWAQLRGIFFALQKESAPAAEPEITFRPGPGFPLDCLRAKLLRWDDAKLIVQHGLFGEIAIERGRLDKIRFAAK